MAALALAVYGVIQTGLLPKTLAEPVTLALPLGILIGNAAVLPEKLRTGVRYTIKTLLTLGIILLGARLNFGDLARVGGPALLMSLAQVILLLGLAWTVRRWLGLGDKQATLLGIGTAICGLDARDFGRWAGLAIHQRPQAVAAGFAYSAEAGQTATLVKLARVSLLAPVVLVIGLIYRRRAHREAKHRKKLGFADFVPPMAACFLALALLHSLGLLPALAVTFPAGSFAAPASGTFDLAALCKVASGFLLAMGMAAVGLETSLRRLKRVGWRPLAAGFALAVAGLLISFAAVQFRIPLR